MYFDFVASLPQDETKGKNDERLLTAIIKITDKAWNLVYQDQFQKLFIKYE